MEITYLGHAGFCVETNHAIIIMDPWLSKTGAFDSAWFQYPRNHHMAQYVQKTLKTSKKEKYIYISHEHKDHFDISFLESLNDRDFTLILAKFSHSTVKQTLLKRNYHCKKIISLKDCEDFHFKEGVITLFLIDTELDCDSAILVRAENKSFLNLNDCKIHERLEGITQQYGKIDVFTAQFSGASWHPTCYKMPEAKYQVVCQKKMFNKFDVIARSLETLTPKIYLPSAGPACFLDPLLLPINFQKINTYPRAPVLFKYLNERLPKEKLGIKLPEIMPGDTLDVDTLTFTHLEPVRINEADVYDYIQNYAADYQDFFQQRQKENSKADPVGIFDRLKPELEKKLAALKLIHHDVSTPIYWCIQEYKEKMYCIHLDKKTIETVHDIKDKQYFFKISAPAWVVNKVLNREISWPDFALTFRVELERTPDVYNNTIHGFLTLEAEQIGHFCELAFNYQQKKERIIVEHQGKKYSVLRYCPHQGGDLSQGWMEGPFLVCPRHQWHFDLEKGGKCKYNDATIDAICLSDKNPL